MPRALEIQIDVTRLDRAVDSVRRLSAEVRGLGGGNGGGGGGGAGARPPGVLGLTPADMRRQLRLDREAGRGAFESRAITALRSTRFSAGGISPLVGRTADVLGMPTTGGAGLAFAGAAAGVAALAMATRAATENLNQFGEAMRLSGGTAADVAGIGRFGFRGAAGAGAAAGFVQRISVGGDPMAQMYAARYGLGGRLGRPFGQVNEAQTLRQGVEVLRGITDAEERLRVARVFQLESALKYLDISPQIERTLEAQRRLEEQIAGGDAVRAANDLDVSLEALGQSFRDLASVLLPPVIQGLTQVTNALNPAAYKGFSFRRLWENAMGGSDLPGGIDYQESMDRHTDALQRHADKMEDVALQPGIYGGGAGTSAAAPGGWSGDYLARQMQSGALGRGVPIR